MEWGIITVFFLITLYTAACNYFLIKRNDRVVEELQDTRAELARLKLLSRMKVDCNGDPIVYEGQFVMDSKTAIDMLDNPPEPNDALKEILGLK